MMFEGKARLIISHDWITNIFIVSLFLIALTYTIYPERMKKLFSLFYSDKYYSDYATSKPVIANLFHGLLFPVFIFNISLLVFVFLQVFKLIQTEYNFGFYLKILAFVMALILIRWVIGVIIGVILEVYEEQRYLTFLKISNLVLSGFYLLPLMIVLIYTPLSYRVFLVYSVAAAIVSLLLFRYFSFIRNDHINFNTLFYLILYLCALEITPFIISYKLFVK